MKIARESLWIAAIGIADLITTLIWVHYHGAQEGNPVFAHYLRMGIVWFALMKILLLAGPIYLLEWARRRRPRFTLNASRVGIGAYCGMYALGFLHLNPDIIHPTSAVASPGPMRYRMDHGKARRLLDVDAAKRTARREHRHPFELASAL